jgi:aerobic-type carbon monoxide dehydrogenase small subunit (CoxS/CutS family)
MPTRSSEDGPLLSITRRRFIQGAGAGTAAALIAPGVARAQIQIDEVMEGRARVPVDLRVNGRAFRVNVEPRSTLLDVLRNQLDLTGTKKVCDRGECGACTVIHDGKPVYSCLMLALDAQGREIRTIESVAKEGRLSPLQEAFVRHDALQCGFCTPGMVMSLTALLESNPSPTTGDVRQAISGNLCKCGTYPKIFRAVQDAAAAARGGR